MVLEDFCNGRGVGLEKDSLILILLGSPHSNLWNIIPSCLNLDPELWVGVGMVAVSGLRLPGQPSADQNSTWYDQPRED